MAFKYIALRILEMMHGCSAIHALHPNKEDKHRRTFVNIGLSLMGSLIVTRVCIRFGLYGVVNPSNGSFGLLYYAIKPNSKPNHGHKTSNKQYSGLTVFITTCICKNSSISEPLHV